MHATSSAAMASSTTWSGGHFIHTGSGVHSVTAANARALRHAFWRGWATGGFWPALAASDWGWGYPYARGYYPNGNNYYFVYPPVATAPPKAIDDRLAANEEARKYYADAKAAFLEGDYRNALRLASHAGVESPQNPQVHELISLALFAAGNYPDAAAEAHAALSLGTITDWNGLYRYYHDVDKYATHLRALEQSVIENPKSAAEHFLLGYHYLMTGARDNARTQFAQAVRLTPSDKLAGHFLRQLQINGPLTPPPQMASRPQGKSY